MTVGRATNVEQPFLEMKGISKSFPGVRALDDVDFALRAGEVHVLMGENGAGKSTLMKILSGTYPPDGGEIWLRGTRVQIRHPSQAIALGISTIYQELLLVPDMTVAENILLGREVMRSRGLGIIDWAAMRREADRVLNGVLEGGIDVGRILSSLSLAQQQLVEIARAIARGSEIIIMDEPTSALTSRDIGKLFDVIRKLKREGKAIVYISHRMDEIYQIGDRATVLRDGCLVGTHDLKDVTTERLIRMMVGRELREQFPKEVAPLGEPALEVSGVSRGDALKDIRLEVRRGEIVGLAGLVGSERTELARAIFGADPIDRGTIRVDGREVALRSPRDGVAAGIGLIPEDRKLGGLVGILPVRENVTMALLTYALGRWRVDRAKERALASRYVSQLQVKTPSLERAVRFLSGGNQQKVVVAKWLCTHSKVLIFDEPTRGIDVGAKVEIYKLMNELARSGVGILMISSEIPEILGMSDRILVMHRGRIAGEFPRRHANQEVILRCALSGAA